MNLSVASRDGTFNASSLSHSTRSLGSANTCRRLAELIGIPGKLNDE